MANQLDLFSRLTAALDQKFEEAIIEAGKPAPAAPPAPPPAHAAPVKKPRARAVNPLQATVKEVGSRPRRSQAERTDPHRPGAIVPGDYEWVLDYAAARNDPSGWPEPPYNLDAALAIKPMWQHPTFGKGLFKCNVCGANFKEGTIFFHEPSGDHITMGHDCAHKYQMLYDASAWQLEKRRREKARATWLIAEETRRLREAGFAKLYDEHPWLDEALKVDHPIIKDIAFRLQDMREPTLSPKQVDLVKKLWEEKKNPRPAEANVPAPTGRTTFEGLVVKAEERETAWGFRRVCTIKVVTPAGVWLAWGTAPTVEGETDELPLGRGDTIRLTATLEPGKDPHFALYKRPTGVKFVGARRPPSAKEQAAITDREERRAGERAYRAKEQAAISAAEASTTARYPMEKVRKFLASWGDSTHMTGVVQTSNERCSLNGHSLQTGTKVFHVQFYDDKGNYLRAEIWASGAAQAELDALLALEGK